MRTLRTHEQSALEDVVHDLVAAHATPERVAEIADGPEAFDANLWTRLTDELGVGGLLIDEEHGGGGAGWGEMSCVLQQLGRAVAPVPYLTSCVLAVTALQAGTVTGESSGVLRGIAGGDRRATVSIPHEAVPRSVPISATLDGDAWFLTGADPYVIEAVGSHHALVLAETADGHAWLLVDTSTAGVQLTPLTTLDATRPMARLEFEHAPARFVVARGRDAEAVTDAVVDAAATGLACEQRSAASELLSLSVEHAKVRYQFGQPIGSFQAIQHRLADLALVVDEMTSATEFAVWALTEAPHRAHEAASLAKVVCGEGYVSVANEAIQVHGGTGFTWEHVCHRHFRRARASSVLFGSPMEHRDRILAAIGLEDRGSGMRPRWPEGGSNE